jgi:hypothetical protein
MAKLGVFFVEKDGKQALDWVFEAEKGHTRTKVQITFFSKQVNAPLNRKLFLIF